MHTHIYIYVCVRVCFYIYIFLTFIHISHCCSYILLHSGLTSMFWVGTWRSTQYWLWLWQGAELDHAAKSDMEAHRILIPWHELARKRSNSTELQDVDKFPILCYNKGWGGIPTTQRHVKAAVPDSQASMTWSEPTGTDHHLSLWSSTHSDFESGIMCRICSVWTNPWSSVNSLSRIRTKIAFTAYLQDPAFKVQLSNRPNRP